MKRVILIILLLTAGIGVIVYPFLGNYLNQKNASQALKSYQGKVEKLSTEDIDEYFREAQIYNENLLGQPAHDPFIPGSGIVMPDNYYQVLNVDGTMGQVEIPSIDVKLPIYHGTRESVLKRAVGHLIDLDKGDQFYIQVLNRKLAYEVDKISVIEPDQTEFLKAVKDQDYATLLTCTPYGVNSHRLLVRGRRVPYQPKKTTKKKTLSKEQHQLLKASLLTSAIMICLIILTYWKNKKRS